MNVPDTAERIEGGDHAHGESGSQDEAHVSLDVG